MLVIGHWSFVTPLSAGSSLRYDWLGYWILDTGCWMPRFQRDPPKAGKSSVRYDWLWMLDTGYSGSSKTVLREPL
jgi:hypothetical protein